MGKKVKEKVYVKLSFTLHKMPVSLINSLLQNSSTRNATFSVIRREHRTTKQMVADALIEFHNTKGITLRKIYNYVKSALQLDFLSKRRVNLVRKYLNDLRQSEEIIMLNGKGFAGHFKLVDKAKFIKILEDIKKAKNSLNATKKLHRKARRTIKKSEQIITKNKTFNTNLNKQRLKTKEVSPVRPKQVIPLAANNINASMFDTPMVATQVQASTPFISNIYVPQAPEITNKSRRKRISQSEEKATPRSSLPKKKRRLHKRNEV